MHLRNVVFVATLGLLTAVNDVAAQRALTVEACVRMGLENSRGLHASLMQAQYADAKAGEAGAARLPSLKLGGTYARLSDIAPFAVSLPLPPPAPASFTISPVILNNYAARLTVQQPLFTGFRLESGERAARYSAQATRQDYAGDRAELIYGIESACWGLFKATDLKKVADENVRLVETHLTDAEHLYEQGTITHNEALKVQVQLSNARLLQIRAANAVRLAAVGLDNLIGLPLETEVQVRSDVNRGTGTIPDLPLLVRKALENRPELKALKLRVKAGEAGVTLAKSGRLPQVFLTGNYAYARPNPRLLPAQDRFKGTWDVGIAVSMDLWNWGMTGRQTDQARVQLSQAQDALGQLKDAVQLEVTQYYLNAVEAKEKIAVAEQAVGQAEENHRITNERFRAGTALNSDLLDAEVSLLQARTNHTSALVDYEIAQAGLRKVIGQEEGARP